VLLAACGMDMNLQYCTIQNVIVVLFYTFCNLEISKKRHASSLSSVLSSLAIPVESYIPNPTTYIYMYNVHNIIKSKALYSI
jgi:hypothetical protein